MKTSPVQYRYYLGAALRYISRQQLYIVIAQPLTIRTCMIFPWWCDLSIEGLVGIAVQSKNKINTNLMKLSKKNSKVRNSRKTIAKSFWNRNSTQNTRKSINDLCKKFLSLVLSYIHTNIPRTYAHHSSTLPLIYNKL